MKTPGIEKIPDGGLRVATSSFPRVKAFLGGGFYWDHQDLIRESLGEFLPEVQQVQESGNLFGLFRKHVRGREVLCRSVPVGSARVPEHEVRRLAAALDAFKQKADAPDTQPNAREIIRQFRLPDVSRDPDLYRLTGPWWDRKLQVLWGCEGVADSSLEPAAAVAKLPIDKAYKARRALSVLGLLLLLCALLAACFWGWPLAKRWYAKAFNKPPIAALRVDSLDETNRVAVISDNGSLDPDGALQHWRIAWGDGKEETLATPPRELSHTYGSERDFTISFWCVDNHGATSSPPALTNISFNLLRRQKVLEEARLAAQREAERIKEEAQKEAERLKEEAQRQKELADQQARQAREAQELADKKKAEAELAQQSAQREAERIKQEAQKEAERLKEEAQRQKELADQQARQGREAQELADRKKAEAELAQQSAQREAERAREEAKQEPVRQKEPPGQQTQQADDEAGTGPISPPPAAQSSSTPGAQTPSRPDASGRGATDLIRPEPEIIKGRVGPLSADKTVEAVLVVRDRVHPNRPLDVIEWVVDGKAYRTGNAQFTTRLSLSEHLISVRVHRRGIEQTARARVLVTGGRTQTVAPDLTILPLR